MVGPGTALPIGPCRHGPDTSRAVPCPGTTGRAVLRAGPFSPARLAIYTSSAGPEDGFHHQKLEEEVTGRPARGEELRLSPAPAPARMMNILEAEGGTEIAARLASPHPGAGGHHLG